MDIVNYYLRAAHSDKPKFNHCWLRVANEKANVISFLSNAQEGSKPIYNRISYENIEKVLTYVQSKVDHDLITKLVIQKANLGVSAHSKVSGVWTHLAFLLYDHSAEDSKWILYGYGRMRLREQLLQLNKGDDPILKNTLGYSVFVSVSERNKSFDGSLGVQGC